MSIVKMRNKKTGVTYVYESESYWDKEKQQPRNRKKLIGKIDPETGEIVPTGKRGRKKKEPVADEADKDIIVSLRAELAHKDEIINDLKLQVIELQKTINDKNEVLRQIRKMAK